MRAAVSKENVELLRELYARRTLEEFGASLHQDAEMRQARAVPDTDDYYGREGFLRGLRLWPRGMGGVSSPRRSLTSASER